MYHMKFEGSLGDLTEMLYPLNSELEENEYYQKDWSWDYVNEVTDNMDEWIETESPSPNGTLLMYRDSFCESMLPFFAEEFSKGYFQRLVPYDLGNVLMYESDYTIIERVERKIPAFASEIPIMSAPRGRLSIDSQTDTKSTLNVEKAEGITRLMVSWMRIIFRQTVRLFLCLRMRQENQSLICRFIVL